MTLRAGKLPGKVGPAKPCRNRAGERRGPSGLASLGHTLNDVHHRAEVNVCTVCF